MVERLKSELRGRAGWAVRGSKGRKGAAQEGQGRELDGEKANWQGLIPLQSGPPSNLFDL